MKTIFILFALALLCSQALASIDKDNLTGAWKVIDTQKFMEDSENQRVFESAKQQFIAQASQANEISSTQLTVQEIKEISTQVVAGWNIRFEMNLVDDNGKVYDVTLVVFYQPWTNTDKLTEYKINKWTEYEL